jgi:hypothetical protein
MRHLRQDGHDCCQWELRLVAVPIVLSSFPRNYTAFIEAQFVCGRGGALPPSVGAERRSWDVRALPLGLGNHVGGGLIPMYFSAFLIFLNA